MVSEKKRKWRRKNGLSWPLDPLQLVAWFFTLVFALIYFGVMIPSQPTGACQLVSIYVMAVFLGVHSILHLTCNIVDPADPEVRAKKQEQPLPDFSRKKHSHVIENQYCHICEVKVGSNSKHCSACNKCVDGFDHHCKWLNNCVGKRNYRLFLACITTALISSLLLIILSIICAVQAVAKTMWMCSIHEETTAATNNTTTDFSTNSSSFTNWHYLLFVPITKQLWLAIIFVTLLLAGVAFALLVHLLGFHLYLIFKGFSTYEYILRQRELEDDNVGSCNKKKRGKQCSLSQSNKRISPHKPNSIEYNNSSHHRKPLNMYKLNGVAQMKKETLNVSKEGLCSSGDVYIGSPAKSLRNDSIHSSKNQEIYQNDGFSVDFKPNCECSNNESNRAQSDNDDGEISDIEDKKDVKASLKSRSPSLNNLMVDEDYNFPECESFDNLDDCKEPDDTFVTTMQNEFEMKEKYIHHINEYMADNGRNNNCETSAEDKKSGSYELNMQDVNYRNMQNARSLSVDNYDGMKICDPLAVSKRRCSVEIHHLNSGQYVPSLTPVESENLPEKMVQQQEQKRRQSNQNVLQTIHNHIV